MTWPARDGAQAAAGYLIDLALTVARDIKGTDTERALVGLRALELAGCTDRLLTEKRRKDHEATRGGFGWCTHCSRRPATRTAIATGSGDYYEICDYCAHLYPERFR